jgi:hypothetical protein
MGSPSDSYTKATITSDDNYDKDESTNTIKRKSKSAPRSFQYFDNIYGLPILYPEFSVDPKLRENSHPYASPILGPLVDEMWKLERNPFGYGTLSEEEQKKQYERRKAVQAFRATQGVDPYDEEIYSGLSKEGRAEVTKIMGFNFPEGKGGVQGFSGGPPLKYVWDQLFDRDDIGAYITKIGMHQLKHENIYGPIFNFNNNFLYKELLSKRAKSQSFGERSFWNKVLTPIEFAVNMIASPAGLTKFMDLKSSAGEENIRDFEKKRQEYLASGLGDYKSTVEAYRETEFNPYYKGALEFIQPGDLLVELAVPGGIAFKPLVKTLTRSSRTIRFNEIPTTAFISWKNGTFLKSTKTQYERMLRENTSFTEEAIQQKLKQYDNFGVSQKDLDALEEVGVIKKNNKGEYTYKVTPLSEEGRHYTEAYNNKWTLKDNIIGNPDELRFNTKTGQAFSKTLDRTEKDVLKAMGSPNMAGETFNGTIYDVFPELRPQIEKLQKQAKIIDLSSQPTLTRNPDLKDIPPQSTGKTFRDEGVGAVEAFDLPRMFGATEPAAIEDQSAIVGKLITEFEKPPIINRIFNSDMIGKRQVLNNKEIRALGKFLNKFGIDLQSHSPDIMGRGALNKAFVNSDTGRNEYVIGIFDDPTKPSYSAGYNSAPYERFHILYSPFDNTFTVRQGLEPRVQALDTSTGRNISKEIENVSRRFDLEIESTRSLQALEPVLSPEYNRLSKIIYAREQAKEKRIRKLEELLSIDRYYNNDITYVPDLSKKQRKKINDADTVKFIEMKERLYPQDFIPKALDIKYQTNKVRRDTVMMPDPDDIFSVKGAPEFKLSIERSIDPPDFGQKRLNDIYIDTLHNARDYGNQYESMAAAIELAARERGLPKPSIPHGTAAMTNTWNDSVSALDNALHGNADNIQKRLDDKGIDIVAQWWGHLNSEALDTQEWINKSREIMERAGIGHKSGNNNWFVSREESEELMKIIFANENTLKKIKIPEKYQELYDHLMIMRDKEQSDYLQFNPKLEDMFNEHVNYFPQIWKAPEGQGFVKHPTNGKWLTHKPEHFLPRIDTPFEEKLEMGWDLVSWNPFDLMAIRRMRGIEHRHSALMIDRLKRHGIAKDLETAAKWNDSKPTIKQRLSRDEQTIEFVKPNFGPAWDGRTMVNPLDNSEVVESGIYLPRKVAQTIEGITQLTDDSLKIDTKMGTIDVGHAIGKFASVSKRTIIQFSLFQHNDMLNRGLSAGMSPTHLTSSGKKIWNPLYQNASFAGRLVMSQLWAGDWKGLGRAATRKRLLSDVPLYDDFDISFKDLVKAGLQINGDTSVISRSHLEQIKEIENSISKNEYKKFPQLKDRLIGAAKWWETGLFDGVYRETQLFIAEKQVIPQLRKRYPNESKEFIARKAADTINTLTSSLAPWQSMAKNPQSKALTRALFFSTNELESWAQAGWNTIRGDQKGIYAQYWIGMYMYLASLGNVMNFLSTGSLMPLHAYSPITMKNKDGAWVEQFPVTYNPRFLSPIIGFAGRNGAPLYADIVGQADTVFHYVTGGITSLGDRTSPFVSFFKPYVTGKTFYGEELDSFIDKTKYAALSVLPMGSWQAIDKFREEIPFFEKHFPQSETGLNDAGRMIQGITGMNIRKASYDDLLSEAANIAGYEKVPITWKNIGMQLLDPKRFSAYSNLKSLGNKELQRVLNLPQNKHIQDELARRLEEGVVTNQPWALRGTQRDQYADQRMDELEALAVAVQTNEVAIRDWYDMMKDIDSRYYIQLAVLDDVYTKEDKERPDEVSKPLEAALYDFYQAFENSKEFGRVDWQKLEYEMFKLENQWSPQQSQFIADYQKTKNYDINYPSWFVDKLMLRDKYNWYFSMTPSHMEIVGMLDIYRNYLKSNNQKEFKDNRPEFKAELEKIENHKKALRESPEQQELLLMLTQLGYVEASTYLRIVNENNK